ncbi:MAG: Cellulase [Acidimicrobiaceae bacterium]|nr:Cellulase [Acidimicrobiaceae bacterium]
MSILSLRRVLCCVGFPLIMVSGLVPLAAGAQVRTAGTGRAPSVVPPTGARRVLGSTTRLFVRTPDQEEIQQGIRLTSSGDLKDAAMLAKMEITPQAIWLTGGTPAQVEQLVRKTMVAATLERAVPTFVAYDIPGRDCGGYSVGGALDQALYVSWIRGIAAGLRNGPAVVLLEPDSLGLLPSSCSASDHQFSDAARFAELRRAVTVLERRPKVSVYLDGTRSDWLDVGQISRELVRAGVARAQGFFLDVGNFQPTPELVDFGTWISDCIAFAADPEQRGRRLGRYGDCASQYSPASESNFGTWGLTTQWYAANMGDALATTHFVIDTSRNGRGPTAMSVYGSAPYDQPPSVVSTLAHGSWCNPPGAGLGIAPTTHTGVPLLDAYLWVKIPGESDGHCDAGEGARSWNYGGYSRTGWPTASSVQALFDPLWGRVDPPSGAWFAQQALQLAKNANPPLSGR